MANMGASGLVLVRPNRWDTEKAASLATSHGIALLDSVIVEPNLETALASFSVAFGTTARTGGWRKDVISPEKAAGEARAVAREGGKVALVFGPEDKGLNNEEVEICTRLVNIPTAVEHSSLNLAQAVLLMLYECMKADMALAFDADNELGGARGWSRPARSSDSRRATIEEERLLLATLQEILMTVEHLPKDNPGWFMQPMRHFLRKSRLRRHEFDMLMGICRQIRHKLTR
jgi:tRNA/rRNA methyltransferase